jgi:hypothetical protein
MMGRYNVALENQLNEKQVSDLQTAIKQVNSQHPSDDTIFRGNTQRFWVIRTIPYDNGELPDSKILPKQADDLVTGIKSAIQSDLKGFGIPLLTMK